MSKAIQGAVMLTGAVGMGVAAFLDPALIASPLFDKIWASLVIGGISMEAGAIAGALTSNRGTNITTRQAAAFRQIIYGQQRVGGILVYESTTGSKHDQYNAVIVLAGHPCESIVNLYLDGRKVFWEVGSGGNVTQPDGNNFGGSAAGGSHVGPGGANYDFGGLVYAEMRNGTQVSGDVIAGLTANDPSWAANSEGNPWLGGCTYLYLKIEYDTNMFPSGPASAEVRITVNGKNNIMDPRTGTAGWTSNWALIVADVLQDTQFGLGDVGNVNTAQLIAAANVCDEAVALAAGGTEQRYACHWHYDTSTAPGDALNTMMTGAVGGLSQINGEWYIWPAYWQGPSFTFDENALTDVMSWRPNRSLRDLFNCVNGTYIAPNFPYNNAGNLYDSNGWYDGTIENTFPFAFQPTNYPQYAVDTLHGYASNQYLEDDGKVLPHEMTQSTVLSITQAQRCAKIALLRNRQQGSGSFTMNLAAWGMQPKDVMNFTFPAMGWSEKVLEVVSTKLKLDADGDVPALRFSVEVQETAATVYEWSTTEELTVYDVPANPATPTYTPVAPTDMTLTSGPATAVQTADGVLHPRIEIQWDVPLDILVKQVQVQYQPVAATGAWIDNGLVDVGNTVAYIPGVVAGTAYNVRIRSLRANGAASPWVEIDGYTVSLTLSVVGVFALAPGTLVAQAFSDGTADIIVSPFTAVIGNNSVSVLPGGLYTITGLAQQTLYFVYYIDPTFAGGAITPIATTNEADFLNKPGYFLIDSIVTPAYVSGGGGGGGTSGMRYAPSTYADLGSSTTSTPPAAYDGNLSSCATVTSNSTPAIGSYPARYAIGHCRWSGFTPATASAAMTLSVTAALVGTSPTGHIDANIGGTTVSLAALSGPTATATYTASVPSGTALGSITVDGASDAGAGTSPRAAGLQIYEIYIE